MFHLTVVDNPLKITSDGFLVLMVYHIVKSCKWDKYIQNSEHAYQVEITSADHIAQLVKQFLRNIFIFGKRYTREVINKSQASFRHQLLKLTV